MKQTNKRVYRAPLTATLDARVLVVTTKGSLELTPFRGHFNVVI